MESVIRTVNFSVCHMFAFPIQSSLPNPNTCPNCSHTPFQHPAIAEESDERLLLCGRPVLTVLGVSPDLFWSVRLSGFDETKGGRKKHFQQNREGSGRRTQLWLSRCVLWGTEVWGLRKPTGSPATALPCLFMQETDLISDNGGKGFLSACLKREQWIFPLHFAV